jgi:hypothetical protein
VLVKMTHVGINGGCETFRARGEHLCVPGPFRLHVAVPQGAPYTSYQSVYTQEDAVSCSAATIFQ